MGGGRGRGQGGCERRIEVCMKIQKKKLGGFGGGGRGVSGRGQVVGGGVRVDVNEELKFFVKIQKKKKKKKFFFGGGVRWGGGGGGVGSGGG